jgi:hypothetical protein
MNLIPQFIDDPNEEGKNKGILVGVPGYHLAGTLAGVAIRGLWSGGGRLFAVGCPVGGGVSSLYELGVGDYVGGNPSTGAGTSTAGQTLGSVQDDNNPAQMFGNGNQLLIVKNGFAWIDQGAGPAQCRFLISGTANTVYNVGPNTTTVTWVSGDYFPPLMFGGYITINGTNYAVSVYTSTTSLTVSGNAGTSTSPAGFYAPYGDPVTAVTGAYLDSYFIVQRPAGQLRGTVGTSSSTTVTSLNGDNFSRLVPNQQIIIDGVPYTVATIDSSTSLTLTGATSGSGNVSYSAIVQTLSGTVMVNGALVGWLGGSQFDEVVPGQQITIFGLNYTVDQVFSATTLAVTVNIFAPAVSPSGPYAFTAAVGTDLGGHWNISAPGDGGTWDPLDFATKESDPSYLQSIAADHEQLYLMGTGGGNSEIWQNTGDPTFPFQRITGAAARLGSVARYSPAAVGGKMFLLAETSGGGPVAYRLDGFTPVRVSTHAEEQAWSSGVDTPSGAIAYGEVHDGHQFWVINFPGALHTWVYDETASQQAGTPIWHQRAKWSGSSFTSYEPVFHVFVPEWGRAGMHIVAGSGGGNWYELNLNYFDDSGADKCWVRILPHLYAAGNWQFHGRMTLEMETGTASSLVTQPTITRDYSADRGHTFINPSSPITGGAGVDGAYSQRVFWGGTSASRDRVWRLSGTGQYQTTLIDLDVEVEAGVV